ncbi:hypothetical protein BH10BAC5_BH10BAC5_12080 [soil metagenome]
MAIIKKAIVKKPDEKKDRIIEELTGVFNDMGYSVRIEKGAFKGGFCLLKAEKVFLLNRNIDQDRKISILAKNIAELGTEDIFLKPNIRDLVDKYSVE